MRVGGVWLIALAVGIGCSDSAAPLAGADSADTPRARRSVYVPARDGTRLAVDVHLPNGWKKGEKIPAVFRITRYWRQIETSRGETLDDPYADAISQRGYAYVTMDVRGSGASFGVSTMPWSEAEVLDYHDVLEWIVEQPWSNQRVGALGDSYEGNTAALLSALEHPAVRAVVPRFFDWDPYVSPAFPGGLFHEDFIRAWSDFTQGLDAVDVCKAARTQSEVECSLVASRVRGPLRVDEDVDGKLLAQAVEEHRDNTEVYGALEQITYRDDNYGDHDETLADVAVYARAAAINRGDVPWFSWGSWYDSGTADAALNAFASLENPQEVVIGAWSHGAQFDADPYHESDAPSDVEPAEQLAQALDFIDRYVQEEDAPRPRTIRYYTAGEGKWRTTTSWPPKGATTQDWYLAEDALLTTEPPAVEGHDRYTVDFTATSGPSNRWATQKDGRDVVYEDRREESSKLLNYTSPALTASLHVVGHPVVALYLSSSSEDAAVIVYLEDVAPDGGVTYVTEGQLRLIHRRQTQAPYVSFGAAVSFARADGAPVVPDRVEPVQVTLLPVSALIQKGHRLRVSIAGHDAGTFRRYPAEGASEFVLERSPNEASRLTLPVLP